MQASTCLELRLPATVIEEEPFALLAAQLDALGSAEEIDADLGTGERIAWFDPEGDAAARTAAIHTACRSAGIEADAITLNTIAQQDWETAWQRDWHGMAVGERLWVRPSFCDAPSDDRIDIVLDPGMAFGTGTHPTTQLCLCAIERCCSADYPPATLLDMGAGSGLLAIAALKLGVRESLAIDMEEDSVAACRANAAINGVRLDVALDDTPPTAQFDLVVANILASPLVWMAKELAATVADRLVLSGLLIEQVDDVAAAYCPEGLREVRRDAQQEWASVEFCRDTDASD